MNSFILMSAVMLAAALLLLAPALLRRQKNASGDTREHNVRIARERLEELEQAHAQGELSDEEFAQAKEDLQIALAQDLSQTDGSQQQGAPVSGRLTLLGLVIFIPALVYFMYLETGAPQHLAVVGPGQPAPVIDPKTLPPIEELVVVLEQRLDADPKNPQGWFLLGRTLMKLQRFDDAVRAYQKLNKHLPNHPQAMLALADAQAMQANGQISADTRELLKRVLDIEPETPTALWLLGQGAQQQGDLALARAYWQRALPFLSGNPALENQLRMLIAQSSETATTQEQAPATASDANGGVSVQVALAPELFDQLTAESIVFIYAKAVSGPPMPLAVSRHSPAELPLAVRLTDGMAMMPQMKLSNFERVLVGARISKTGQAIAQPGDLQSQEVEVSSADGSAQLLIDHTR